MVSVWEMTDLNRHLIISGVFLLCLAVFMCYPVSADINAQEYVHCTGGLTSNNAQSIVSGDNISKVWRAGDQYQEINAGQQIVTLPGNSEYDTATAINAGLSQNTNLAYSGGGAVWDTLYQGSLIPNVSELACTAGELSISGEGSTTGSMPLDQSVNGQIGSMGPNGVYTSGKYASGQTYALSGDFTGRGAYYGDLYAASGAGANKDSDEQNYGASMRRHVLGVSNLSGGIIAQTDWTADDPRNIFNFTEVNETVNETVSIPVNLSTNTTEDA